MRVELNDAGGYRLDHEEAIGDLLRSNGLEDAKAMRKPIGDDSKKISRATLSSWGQRLHLRDRQNANFSR